MKEHFEPKPIRAAERYYFRQRLQAPGESIADYVAELRRLSTHCQFDGFLEDELCNQLVCGLRNDNMRKRLFAAEKLTFKVFELTQSYEAANKNAQQLKETATGSSAAVQRVTFGSQQSTTKHDLHACHRCGLTNHKADKCRFKEATSCLWRAHKEGMYKQEKKTMRGSKQTKWIDTDQQEQDSGDEGYSYSICYTEQASNHPIHVQLLLDGKPCDLKVDTGAAVSILSEKQLNRVLPGAQLKKTNVSLRTYTSQKIPVKGKLDVEVQYGQRQSLTLTGDGPCLMGRDWLKHIRLN